MLTISHGRTNILIQLRVFSTPVMKRLVPRHVFIVRNRRERLTSYQTRKYFFDHLRCADRNPRCFETLKLAKSCNKVADNPLAVGRTMNTTVFVGQRCRFNRLGEGLGGCEGLHGLIWG
ncbi:hypothetical protein A8V01_15965 [Novosphingobium guangzhouense]|uniref:Uncharacterized protein n=1 Tax=Novosphingobium guangzhouense TaxID=1850347 RepID=A0A2K2G363_9SPHN|nr:hypothetical protein A8V01_15965 [Novosphingobium guangzhouense]